eukprot:5976511-Amphidinium_carterae.1
MSPTPARNSVPKAGGKQDATVLDDDDDVAGYAPSTMRVISEKLPIAVARHPQRMSQLPPKTVCGAVGRLPTGNPIRALNLPAELCCFFQSSMSA